MYMTIDLRWNVPTASQLWLKWKSINHTGNGIIELINPEFYGPVLADCLAMEETGYIKLDLTKHFIVLILEPYEVILNWNKKLSQNTKTIKFDKMVLEDKLLGLLTLLKNKDEILIDCSGHTTERSDKRKYSISFPSMVYDESKNPYNLTKK